MATSAWRSVLQQLRCTSSGNSCRSQVYAHLERRAPPLHHVGSEGEGEVLFRVSPVEDCLPPEVELHTWTGGVQQHRVAQQRGSRASESGFRRKGSESPVRYHDRLAQSSTSRQPAVRRQPCPWRIARMRTLESHPARPSPVHARLIS
jgi:hypothetical protein